MEIELLKYDSTTKKQETEYLKINSYKVLCNNINLLLIRDGSMEVKKGEETSNNFREIVKVQFIASCKTKFDNEILVAFYLGEYFELSGYILSGMTDNYSNGGEQMYLVDYKSYCDICELTAESKLSFTEYFEANKNSIIGINSLLSYNGQELNFNKQKDLFKIVDEAQN